MLPKRTFKIQSRFISPIHKSLQVLSSKFYLHWRTACRKPDKDDGWFFASLKNFIKGEALASTFFWESMKYLQATPLAFGSLWVYFMCSMRFSPLKNNLWQTGHGCAGGLPSRLSGRPGTGVVPHCKISVHLINSSKTKELGSAKICSLTLYLADVSPQRALGGETFPTHTAVKRSILWPFNLCVVVAKVLLKIRQLNKGSPTFAKVTSVRSFSWKRKNC